MTFENFAACFQLIDRANPEKSKLLSYASTPHANLKAPVYRQGSRHYEAIANWVKTAALSETDGVAGGRSQLNRGHVQLATAVEELQYSSLPDDSANAETRMIEFPGTDDPNANAAGQRRLGVDPFDPSIIDEQWEHHGIRTAD